MTARFGCDLGGGWRQTVRNAIFRRLPAGQLVKAGQSIVRWTAPSSARLTRAIGGLRVGPGRSI